MMTGMNNPYMTEEDQQRMMAEMMRSKQKREQEAEMRRQQLQMQPQQQQQRQGGGGGISPSMAMKFIPESGGAAGASAASGSGAASGGGAVASGSMSGTGTAAMSSVAPTSSVFTAGGAGAGGAGAGAGGAGAGGAGAGAGGAGGVAAAAAPWAALAAAVYLWEDKQRKDGNRPGNNKERLQDIFDGKVLERDAERYLGEDAAKIAKYSSPRGWSKAGEKALSSLKFWDWF